MKHTFLLSLLFLSGLVYTNSSRAQSNQFNTSASCEENVNGPGWASAYDDIKRATFKFSMTGAGGGTCTGVLINQKVNQNQQQQYFLTAQHCFDNTDPSTQYYFLFNYQSKDANNSSVPLVNQGASLAQSDDLNVSDGYQCYFTSPITVVEHFGDMTLCKINNPIPPHYNVFYAGWLTYSYTYTYALFDLVYGSFKDISHPQGDIKKIAKADIVFPFSNPINTGCTVVTTIIDWLACELFGWCNVNTEVICNYVDIPFYLAPGTADGTMESGSSGSPLFSSSAQILGTLSSSCIEADPQKPIGCNFFQVSPCAFIVDFEWWKFKHFYEHASVKNALNPSHDQNVNFFGLPGRQIACIDNLNFGGYLDNEWYPLGNYQSDNHLELHANNDINFVGPVHIHDGSDYTLSAGGNINGTTELTIDNVQDVTLKPGDNTLNCNPNNYREIETDPIKNIIASFPKSKKFDVNEYNDILTLRAYPNPSSKELNISYLTDKSFSLQIFDVMGKSMFREEYKSDGLLREQKNTLDISNYATGFYIVKIQTEDGNIISKKVVKQ